MIELLKILLSLSLSGALLILVLLLCKPLYKNRLSKRWQYYIWLIVVARLLLPFTPETSLVGNLFREVDSAIVQISTSGPTDSRLSPETDFAEHDTPPNNQADMTTGESPELEKTLVQRVLETAAQNIWLICVLGWLMVSVGLLIRKVTIYQSFVKYINAGRMEVTDMKLWEQLGKLVEQARVKRAVELYTNSLISSPLLIGFLHPCIMLPSLELSDSDLKNTILHELTHYKRRDMFYKWLVQVAICFHWFNPFVYFMGKEINRACEFSCDEAVIRTFDKGAQRAYGDTLLNAIEAGGNYNNSVASVMLNENAELLKERLDAIMRFKKSTRFTAAISVVLVFALCFGATAAGAYSNTPATNPDGINATLNQPNYAGWDLGQVSRWSISAESENVIVKRGGTSFLIEVSPESKDSYLLEDYMHVVTDRFQEREIALQRKEGLGVKAVYSPTIIITVPDSTKNVMNTINTSSGNISIDNMCADKILAESKTGNIMITNSFATDYIIAESSDGTVTLTNTTSDGYIYIEDKSTSQMDKGGNAHLSQSGYSKDEFAALREVAEEYAIAVAAKDKLGIPQYVGELFDLDVVKGTVSFNFDLDGDESATLSVDVTSDGEVIDYHYWNSPE